MIELYLYITASALVSTPDAGLETSTVRDRSPIGPQHFSSENPSCDDINSHSSQQPCRTRDSETSKEKRKGRGNRGRGRGIRDSRGRRSAGSSRAITVSTSSDEINSPSRQQPCKTRKRRGRGIRGRIGRPSTTRTKGVGRLQRQNTSSTGRSTTRGCTKSRFIGPLTFEESTLSSPWKKMESTHIVYPFSGPQPGPLRPIGSNARAIELFHIFFSDEALELVVAETNRYAAQCRAQCTSPTPRAWHDITSEELKAFFGMLFYMGIARLPQIEMYWSAKHDLIRQNISNVMPLVRFQQILRFLHLNDSHTQISAGQPGYDPLFKVRRLLDIITPKFQQEYNLTESICVDEAMIPFKGRLFFKQYMKDKPVKHGIKVFVLADGKYGYISRIQIYTGKNSSLSQNELGLSTKVVLDLTNGLENSHHKLYVDNYYTSPILFLKLYQNGINCCGTARTNRKHYPAELTYKASEATKFDRGFYDYRACGPLLACAWKDKKIINFLTTKHVAEDRTTVTRTARDGSQKEITCPPCLPNYQEFMRGVDLSDQRMSYYYVGRRSKKWWKRVLAYLLEACVQNAYVLKIFGQGDEKRKDPSFLDFRLELAAQLIGSFSARSRIGRPRSQSPVDIRLDQTKQHLPIVADRQIECVVCNRIRKARGLSRSSFRHESHIKCYTCNVALCLSKTRNCFYIYHNEPVYWN